MLISVAVGKFRRAHVTQPPPLSPTTQPPTTKLFPCAACNFSNGIHKVGYCPLKIAGVEYCNLCGRAHYGTLRTCPQFNSETAVRVMINEMQKSPESIALKEDALKYLRGLKGNLVNQKKKEAEAGGLSAKAPSQVNGTHPASSHHKVSQPLLTDQTLKAPVMHGLNFSQQRPNGFGSTTYQTPYEPQQLDPRVAFEAASTKPRSFASVNGVPPPVPM